MPASELTRVQTFALNTVNVIAADAPVALLKQALALITDYEQLLSRFTAGSDIWRLNHAAGKAIEVGEDTLAILRCAEQVRKASAGAFNIAIGAACALWDFHSDTPALPDAAQLAQAIKDLQDFSLVFEGDRVVLPAGATIDLGGIAKGYICDRVADFLRAAGVEHALLNFGGNVVTIGTNPQDQAWQIGLQAPDAARDTSIFAIVAASDRAVVTSGIYERGFEIEGVRYHHILNPRNGWPIRNTLLSATVVCPSAMLADALATALLVAGAEAGITLAKELGVGAALLSEDGSLACTKGLPIRLLPTAITPAVEIPLNHPVQQG